MSRANIPPLGRNPFLAKQVAPLNRAIEELNDLSFISGDSPFQRGPIGSFMQDPPAYRAPVEFDAVLVNAGPNGEADYTDSRYWFQSVDVAQNANATVSDIATPYVIGADYWYVGTNLAEVAAGTHSLATITPVRVFDSTNADGTARTLVPLPANATLVRVRLIDASKIGGSETDPANWVYEITAVSIGKTPVWGTITASSAVSSVQWNYTAGSYTGSIVYSPLRNLMEPLNGAPGPLGITVNTSGTTSGGCTVKAIGVGAGVLIFPDPTVAGGFAFSCPNSAE